MDRYYNHKISMPWRKELGTPGYIEMSLNSLYMALEELLHLPEVQLLPCKLLGKGTRIAFYVIFVSF